MHNDNYNLFSNIVQSSYFSGTEYQGTGGARNFYFDTGNQGAGGIYNVSYAWAVRDGQVSTVPVPAAAWLLGSGLLGLLGFIRRRLSD